MDWLVLIYKVPREPTAGRVYVWRKLKKLGAAMLQDAVWVLPGNPRTREHFQWLASEIQELGGEVTLLASSVLFGIDDAALRERIEAPVRESYREMLAELKRPTADRAALASRYQETKVRDYFQCDLGEEVREKLLARPKGTESK